MKTLSHIALLAEDFGFDTPAQHLLDRFLLGYPRDGEFHRMDDCSVTACLSQPDSSQDLERRAKDHGLIIEPEMARALAKAQGVILVPRLNGGAASDQWIRRALEKAVPEASWFVHGALASTLEAAKQHVALARSQQVTLAAGTSVASTWRLPDVEVASGTVLSEGLIVVQGAAPSAELEALDGLLPIVERRRGMESGVRSVRYVEGESLWRAGKAAAWSWPLLAAALSRSDSPQGDPAVDGRTQDLVGLGLVDKLAKEPRGWLLEHRDGLRTTLLVLDGVVADYNFAIRADNGAITSAQLLRPPKPGRQQFSRLAGVIEDFWRNAQAPWPIERSLLTAGLLEIFERSSAKSGDLIRTPELVLGG